MCIIPHTLSRTCLAGTRTPAVRKNSRFGDTGLPGNTIPLSAETLPIVPLLRALLPQLEALVPLETHNLDLGRDMSTVQPQLELIRGLIETYTKDE